MRFVSGQSNKGGIKRLHIFPQHFRRIARAIEADHDKSGALSGAAQRFPHRFHAGQRQRTDIRAMGVAKKHQHRFAAQIT